MYRTYRMYKQPTTCNIDVRLLGYYADGGVQLQSHGTAPRTQFNRSTSTLPHSLRCCQHQRKKKCFLHRMSKTGQHRFICSPGREIEYNAKKGRTVPLQACSGPEGSRKLRSPDFMTTAQGGGKVVSLTHRPHLPPVNSPGTHFC